MESSPFDDIVLMPEVLARRALRGRALRFCVLAPVGLSAGCGTLRVLRARPQDDAVELICGYESYVPLFASAKGVTA